MINKEQWKDIKGYKGIYQVSNLGRVKSLEKIIPTKIKNSKMITRKERRLKSSKSCKGYCYVVLSKDNIKKSMRVHKLVAEAFLKKEDFKSSKYEDRENININLLEVNHKDEDKTNNKLENLEWCTRGYNSSYGNRTKDVKKPVNQYDLQGNLIKRWKSIYDAQKELKIRNHINEACEGKRKIAYGYIWKYG